MAWVWIYILTNKNKTTLYVGLTTNLVARVGEHKRSISPRSFTARYNLYMLIYFEGYTSKKDAVKREKYIKRKSRVWKENLINRTNPAWKDLSDDIQDAHMLRA